MSGGAFDYNQYKIRQIWEDIQQELDKQGKEKSKEDLRYYDKEYFEKLSFHTITSEVNVIFKLL
jgi:hemerythrin-like domain-containing protein